MTEYLPIIAVVSVDTFRALRDHLDTLPPYTTPERQVLMDSHGWTLESMVAGAFITLALQDWVPSEQPTLRHQVLGTDTGWFCIDCGQHFKTWPNDSESCAGAAQTPENRATPRWTLIDARTGKRATVASYFTQEQAERALAEAQRRADNGQRPDLVDVMPHLAVSTTPENTATPTERYPSVTHDDGEP